MRSARPNSSALQLAVLAGALLCTNPAHAQTHILSKKIGGTGLDLVTALARDADQHLLVAGRYSDSIDLGNGAFMATGDNDNFLAAYDYQGTHLWSRNLVGSATNAIEALAIDPNGDIVLVGDGSGSLNLGGADLALSTDGSFAARYDADGNHLWSRTLATTSGAEANDVSFDPDGNIIVTGQGLFFDSCVAKLDPDGDPIWQNGNGAVGYGVDVDFLGNVFATGVFAYGTSFGDSMITGVGILDGFLVSYDTDGDLQWFRTFTDNSWCGGQDVGVDGVSRVWLSGFYSWILDFGAGPIQSGTGFETFLSVFDGGNGDALCTQAFAGGGSGSSPTRSFVRADAAGGAVLAADFHNSVATGSDVLNSAGENDVFVAVFSGPCETSWSMRKGGSGDDRIEGLDIGQGPVTGLPKGADPKTAPPLNHGLVIAGTFEQSVDFGGGLLTSAGELDGFVASYLIGASAVPPTPRRNGWMRAAPNPWNPRTTVSFAIPSGGPITLELFDSRGRLLRTLLQNEPTTAGQHEFELDGRGLASGIYRLRLRHAAGELQRSVVLLK